MVPNEATPQSGIYPSVTIFILGLRILAHFRFFSVVGVRDYGFRYLALDLRTKAERSPAKTPPGRRTTLCSALRSRTRFVASVRLPPSLHQPLRQVGRTRMSFSVMTPPTARSLSQSRAPVCH